MAGRLKRGDRRPVEANGFAAAGGRRVGAFFTLSGNTPTTVNGLYRFLGEYKLLRRRSPDALPVIRLASGTYTSRFGSLVHKPILITLRRISGGDVAPQDTSLPSLLDDKIPF